MRVGAATLICSLLLVGVGASTTAAGPQAPRLDPPKLHVDHAATGTAPGYVFVAIKGGAKQPSGPLIVDNKGRVLWYHQVPIGTEVTDFRTQTYRGKPVLTWWQGKISKAGVGTGIYEIYDSSYRPLAVVKAGHGLQGDLHEFQLTPRGTAFVSVYEEVPRDLSSVGGPKKGYAYDSVVQEIAVATGKVVFEWHSLAHVPLEESLQAHEEPARHATKKRPFDYFHVNSIADGPGGTILVSGRNTSAVYLLRRNGSIVWRLGGKKSDFRPAAAVKFRFQHNARFVGSNEISLFDNGGIPKLEPFTRPLVLKIDPSKKTARIVKTFVPPNKIASPYEGNLQLLGNGGALVGWGGVPKVTEFSAKGDVRFQLTLPYGDTYRAYRLPWAGAPRGEPAVSVEGNTVYASWNGKLGIARWQLLAGPDAAHLAPASSRPWAGLETPIALQAPPKAIAVRALDAAGHTLGQSVVVP